MKFDCNGLLLIIICWACFSNRHTCLSNLCGGKDRGTCPKGEYCQVIELGCQITPLHQACRPDFFHSCCPDTCRITCLYGFKADGNNCTLCQCLPNPCDNVECIAPRTCYPSRVFIGAYSRYTAVCECDKSKCQPCPNGYEFENGCRTCRCLSVCEKATCPPDHACVNLASGNYFCEPRHHVCQPVFCNVTCPFGYKTDDKNCLSCHCLPDPCNGVNCISPQTCHSGPRLGSQYPPYEARCVCPDLKCPFCLNGYEFKNSCQTCECVDICSTVSCPDNQLCAAYSGGRYVCQSNLQTTECPSVRCQPCQSGYVTDANGCQTCECKDSCKSCVGLVCGQNRLCCGNLKGCYSCRRPEECLLEPDPCLGQSCRPDKPPPCLRDCGTMVCGKDTTCCSDARGCYDCRKHEECVYSP